MKTLLITFRESQVLDALCDLGQTNLVAERLGISHRTVEAHIQRMMRENGLPNRLTLALAWDRHKRKT